MKPLAPLLVVMEPREHAADRRRHRFLPKRTTNRDLQRDFAEAQHGALRLRRLSANAHAGRPQLGDRDRRLSGLDHFHQTAHSPRQPRIAREQGRLQRFRQRYVEPVVGRADIAQIPAAVEQGRVGMASQGDLLKLAPRKISSVLIDSRSTQKSTKRLGRLDVHQRRCVNISEHRLHLPFRSLAEQIGDDHRGIDDPDHARRPASRASRISAVVTLTAGRARMRASSSSGVGVRATRSISRKT